MQTFLPYKEFTKSVKCLDNKRLGKQRVEALQILNALEPGSFSHWRNHPAVKMWKGFEPALHMYKNLYIAEWILRGFNNTMKMTSTSEEIINPPWITDGFCRAHQSNLLRKDPIYYSQFNWNVPDNLPYIWPVK